MKSCMDLSVSERGEGSERNVSEIDTFARCYALIVNRDRCVTRIEGKIVWSCERKLETYPCA